MRPENLDGHLSALVLDIPSEIDDRHPATANFALDGIAIGEGGFETIHEILHCGLALVATALEYGFGRDAARVGRRFRLFLGGIHPTNFAIER